MPGLCGRVQQMFGARTQRLGVVLVDQHGSAFGFVPGHGVLEVFVVVDELVVAYVRVLDLSAASWRSGRPGE